MDEQLITCEYRFTRLPEIHLTVRYIDTLFALSLTEFTGARNALAARLKQGGRGDEADRVMALVKPSIRVSSRSPR